MKKINIFFISLIVLGLPSLLLAQTGIIVGKVTFVGENPYSPMEIDKDQEVCGTDTRPSTKLILSPDNGIKNALVKVIGVEGEMLALPEKNPLVIISNCEFSTHVKVVPVGSIVDFVSFDEITHNLHTYSMKNRPANFPMATCQIRSLSYPEIEIVKTACDIHKWEVAFLIVQDDPYYSITDENGNYRIKNIPAGTYSLEIWQESLGSGSAEITVVEGMELPVNISVHPKSKGEETVFMEIGTVRTPTPITTPIQVFTPTPNPGPCDLTPLPTFTPTQTPTPSPSPQQAVELPQTGQETSYATGDDGDLQIGVSWPKPRFTDNGDGTITDNLTGLMWLKDASCFGEMAWQDSFDTIDDFSNNSASFNCSDYIASYTDWKLPNINELESLLNLEESDFDEWLESQGFFNVQSDRYHSSTTSTEDTDEALVVGMSKGDMLDKDKFSDYYVWPVRFANGGKIELPQTGQKTSFISDDDGDLQKGVSWPDQRFTDNGDGTITDNLTGLMWLKDASCFGEMTWQDSFDTIDDFSNNSGSFDCSDYTAFYNDWRLPNRKELFSLMDRSQLNPPLSDGHPFLNVQTTWFWSSTTVAVNPDNAWFVYMGYGHSTTHGKTNTKPVWPVRSEPVPTPETTVTPSPTSEITTLLVSPASALSTFAPKVATITALDQFGNTMRGVTITAIVSGNSRKLPEVSPNNAITSTNGEADFTFRFPILCKNGLITFSVGGIVKVQITQNNRR